MHTDDILILTERNVSALLAGRELDLLDVVRKAYEAHAQGDSSLTHSTFLRFPDAPSNRIIALPAYLGGQFEIAGIKWIASFPGNLEAGMERASAVVILNSLQTGRPIAMLEGSVISAKRTAASAALAALHLHGGRKINSIGIIGCGLISFETLRFLHAVFPEAPGFMIYDSDPERAEQFKQRCLESIGALHIEVAQDVEALLSQASIISLATTALKPHIFELSMCAPGSTILHVSLRDLAPEAILSCDNIADDVDHVCRAETSVHLAEQLVGHRNFIRCNLADITLGRQPARTDDESIAVFSPFGLGILDMAVAQLVYRSATEQGLGIIVDSFLPTPRPTQEQAATARA